MKAAIDRVRNTLQEKKRLLNYSSIINEIRKKEEPSIIISEVGKKQVLKMSDVIALCANRSYTEIHLKEGGVIMTSKNLGLYEEELCVSDTFFRTHKSWIVNLQEVLSVFPSKEIMVMSNGLECKLSRFKRKAFKEALNLIANP